MRLLKSKTEQPPTDSRREAKRANRVHALTAVVFLMATLMAVTALEAWRCAHEFIVTEYQMPTDKVTAPIRLLMVSDLHESEFGENNSNLIAKAKETKPDLILCVGDMITFTDTEDELSVGLDFMEAMAKIAPTYMSYGNHETTYVERHGQGLLHAYAERGVIALENRYIDVTVKGQTIRLGGTSQYCFNYGMDVESYHMNAVYNFFTAFCDTDLYRILLCHRPTAYYLPDEAAAYEDWDCDLVLSGHTHGGLWRLPFVGSIYLPQQGLFPKMAYGKIDMGNADMIVGGGLGHEGVLFRLFNPCELVVIEIVPESNA